MILTEIAVKRPITTLMAVLAAILGGTIAMFNLPVDLMPNVDSNMVTIFVAVRGGMPPEDIEHLVTVPIEEAIGTMEGLKHVLSVAKKDRTTITLFFNEKRDVRRASLEVSERLSRIKGKLPKEIEKPIVARYNENDHPVVILSATSSVKTPEVLRTMVEHKLKPILARVPGVANIEISGGRQRKILVEFEKAKMEMHKLPILEVIRQLGVNNLSLTSGKYEMGRDAWGIHFVGDFKTLDDMRQLGVAVTDEGSLVRLGDVAIVRDYYLEPESYARINNQPSVSVYVQKESGANTIRVAKEVIKEVRKFEKSLSSDTGLGVSIDQSVAIEQAIADVRGALTWGALLVAIVLWFFLRRFKQVGVIVLSIPVAVMCTFFAMLIHATLMKKFGTAPPITINVMSLLGIALGIGRMVDDSIVVFINILRRYKQRTEGERQMTKFQLVIDATREMAVPVASSTLIMVVIFLPIVFISADVRRLFADVAFTVVAALIASLVVAVTVVPLLASKLLDVKDQFSWESKLWNKGGSLMGKFPWPTIKTMTLGFTAAFVFLVLVSVTQMVLNTANVKFSLMKDFFGIPFHKVFFGLFILGPCFFMLQLVLNGKPQRFIRKTTVWFVRKRFLVMGGIVASMVMCVLVYAYQLPKEFMGNTEKKEFVIFIELPAGTKLDVSDKIVATAEAEINSLPEVKEVVKTISARVEGWSSKIYVTLAPGSHRTRTVQDVIDLLRPRMKSIGAEYEAFIYFSEPQSSKEISIDVYGKDYLALRDLAVDVAKRMQEVSSLRDVKLRYKPGRPEIKLKVDHARASMFGLNSKTIADSLHAQIRGLRATYFNAGNEQVETVARLSEEDRRTVEHVSNLSMVSKTKKRHIIPIMQFLDFDYGYTPSEVWRRDKERVIQVSANRERLPLSTAVELALGSLKGLFVPVGYHYEVGGDYKKLIKSQKEFTYAFIIMIGLVYMVLACFFESYSQPFLMLLTIPLATAGSVPTLWITGTSVNMGVYIGLLMLGGTVVSNGVILIDRLNAVKKTRGLYRSVLKVGIERAEPIFMTSLTTIAAMLPLTFSTGESADLWAPLALTVVSGITLSSFLTLFVIPAAYVIMENVRRSSFDVRRFRFSIKNEFRRTTHNVRRTV